MRWLIESLFGGEGLVCLLERWGVGSGMRCDGEAAGEGVRRGGMRKGRRVWWGGGGEGGTVGGKGGEGGGKEER